VPALDHGIDEVRRADHHAVDPPTAQHAGGTEALQRIENAGGDVLAGRRLDRADDLALLDQSRVRVGAANLDLHASHAENTLLNLRPQPNAGGPAASRPLGVRKRSEDGSAITGTRWP